MSDAPELNALKAIIDEFDDEVAQQLAEGERADLWTDVEVPVSLLRALLATLREAPVAWRVLAEPNLPVHFALTKADAEHLVNNLLTYRRGCTSARIEPLYASPANEAGAPVAVKKAFFEGFSAGEASGKFGDDTDSDAWDRYALTHPQALTASPVEAPVAVKALEWRKGYCDETVTIQQASNGWLYQVRVLDGGIWLDWPDKPATEFAALETAKAAAQADYETRIRSALTAAPASHGVVTDAMVEDACAAYAEKTGYYVSFHRGLRSTSSDNMRQAMRAALTAALAPALAEGVMWQTMDNAPRDGTDFIGYGCYHYPDDKRPTAYVLIVSYSGDDQWPWLDTDGRNAPAVYSHWQPLPKPPLAAVPEQEPQGVETPDDPMNLRRTCEDPRLTAARYKVCGSNCDRNWHWHGPDGKWHDGYKSESAAVNAALQRLAAAPEQEKANG